MNDENTHKRHLKCNTSVVSTTGRSKVWHMLFASGIAVPVADKNK